MWPRELALWEPPYLTNRPAIGDVWCQRGLSHLTYKPYFLVPPKNPFAQSMSEMSVA